MSWSSVTIADTLPAVFSSAQAAVDSAQKELDAVSAAISRLQAAAADAQARSDAADQMIADLAEDSANSGIYSLTLAPGTGIWSDRILNAAGAPPRDPSAYSAIVCTLSLTADTGSADAVKNSISAAVNTPFLPAPPGIRLPSITPPPPPVIPELPSPVQLPDDEWTAASIADLFPGTRQAVVDSAESIKKEASKTLDGITKMQEKKSEIQQALNDAQQVVDGLTNTGVYSFTAQPEATPTADWYTRLISGTEAEGRPPFDGSLYSTGTVTVVLATSYSQLLERFGKLESILNTSLT